MGKLSSITTPQYGTITDCDKIPDKPFGFVHMEDFAVSSVVDHWVV
jgi:hypothetical protein